MDYDVMIIGGGVTGCSIARSLSQYELSICLLEKDEDVCSGTSKANSGIVHAGYDPIPHTLKAKLNVMGSEMMPQLSHDLDFDYKQNGSMILCFDKENLPKLNELYDRGIANGVKRMQLLSGDEARALEPNLTDAVQGALYCPTSGIVCPFGLTIAFAENAYANGVQFKFNSQVKTIDKIDGGYKIGLAGGESYTTRYVVNAAGVYADVIHNMVSDKKLEIVPKRGNYLLLDKEVGDYVKHTIFQLPGKMGKGVLVTPTAHGNLMVGPTSKVVDDKDDTSTYSTDLEEISTMASMSVKNLPLRKVITSFSGLRAHEIGDDFAIGQASGAPGFFDAAGIESPGLSCSPAIGEYVAEMIAKVGNVRKKEHFITTRKGILRTKDMTSEERTSLIKEKPEYGTIVCRCEQISEGEIIDAITRPLGARSLDGIKRRTRAGMGRCQAGFCTPRTMELLCEKTGMTMEQICKNKKGSELLEENK
ncbi:MAG: NAD(P)/FAD-dependent oxidoreductase [Sphaerochaetaceae bacterium]